jgi:hypothetical protein
MFFSKYYYGDKIEDGWAGHVAFVGERRNAY